MRATTTIAYDGTIIAADGRIMTGWRIISDHDRKIVVRGGNVFAFSGLDRYCEPLMSWFNAGADLMTYPASSDAEKSTAMFVVSRRAGAQFFPAGSGYPTIPPIPFAMGNGCEYAFGAMASGKSALDAVVVACKYDAASGGKIMTVNVADVLNEALKEAAE